MPDLRDYDLSSFTREQWPMLADLYEECGDPRSNILRWAVLGGITREFAGEGMDITIVSASSSVSIHLTEEKENGNGRTFKHRRWTIAGSGATLNPPCLRYHEALDLAVCCLRADTR